MSEFTLNNETVLERISTHFGDAILSSETPYDLLTLVVEPNRVQ